MGRLHYEAAEQMTRVTPEGAVKRDIKRYLDSIEAYHFWPVQMGFGARTVDILACVRGRFVAIEVKKPEGGKLSAHQCGTLQKVANARGIWVVATSVNDVKEAIRAIP